MDEPRSGAYRLLKRGDVVQKGDEFLQDDAVTWVETPHWAVGLEYQRGEALRPARRFVPSS